MKTFRQHFRSMVLKMLTDWSVRWLGDCNEFAFHDDIADKAGMALMGAIGMIVACNARYVSKRW